MSSRTLSSSAMEGRMADIARAAEARAAGRHLAGWLAVLAVGAGLQGCGGPGPESHVPQPLHVEFSGCETVRRGPVCTLPESRRLRLWMEAAPGAAITMDGRAPAGLPVPVAGGLRIEAELASGARETVVEVRHAGATRTWRLAVDEDRPPGWFTEARKVGAAGDIAAARQRVEPRLASSSPTDRGLALYVAARLHLAAGEEERGLAELRRAITAHRESGALSWEVEDATRLAQQLIARRGFAAARTVLEAFPDPQGHADSAFQREYTWGVLATEVGDLRAGLRRLQDAVDHAERGGSLRYRTAAGQVLARELQRAGRTGDARALFARIGGEAAAGLPVCTRAQLHNNQAWSWLLAREAGAATEDPKPLLAEALRTFDEKCPNFPQRAEEQVNVRVNLSLAHLQDGEPGLARRRLAEARQLMPEPDGNILLWWADLEARIDLAAGQARRALAAYRELAVHAREALAPEAEWRAATGEARAQEALQEVPAALAAYGRAEELLERESLLIPMHQGRDTFLGQRDDATRRHLDLLLRAGRPGEALGLARRARSRFLRTLEVSVRLAGLPPDERQAWDRALAAHHAQREALDRAAAEHWRLPGNELRQAVEDRARRLRELRGEIDALLARFGIAGASEAAPPPLAAGEVLLAFHPLPDGWAGFAADATGVVARRLGRVEDVLEQPALVAERLLVPFAAQIRRARQVRLLPYGPLRRVDLHALPFDSDVLLAAKPVAYALDLPASPAAALQGARALVVGDPQGNLPGARSEAGQVEAELQAGRPSPEVRVLLGRQATGPAVRPLLAASGLFHYAGHAVFAGWDSHLPLAAGGRLTVDDVLALPRSPARVVLSGCETGASSEESAVESIGLAHAFLAAGSTTVIAAVRPVADRESAALMQSFYAELPRSASTVEALRRAQLTLRQKGASSAWQSFRAFVP